MVLLAIFLMSLVSTSGCIRLAQKSMGSAGTSGFDANPGSDPSANPYSYPPSGSGDPALNQRSPDQTADQNPIASGGKGSFVSESMPEIPADQYPILHGVRLNETPEALHVEWIPEYTKTYTLAANATGLVVRVDHAPLVISFSINPQNDCLTNPDSCRGSLAHPVQRPHFEMTVRDNATRKIVLEDGYGRQFSSDTNRTLKVYREGTYHLTLSGEFLDVSLGIATGASPRPGDPKNPGSTVSEAMTPQPNDQYWF